VPNFFFRKKEGKKARSKPTTILKTIFSNYDIKEFSEIGNSAKSFKDFLPRPADSRLTPRENEQQLKRKSLQDFPKFFSVTLQRTFFNQMLYEISIFVTKEKEKPKLYIF